MTDSEELKEWGDLGIRAGGVFITCEPSGLEYQAEAKALRDRILTLFAFTKSDAASIIESIKLAAKKSCYFCDMGLPYDALFFSEENQQYQHGPKGNWVRCSAQEQHRLLERANAVLAAYNSAERSATIATERTSGESSKTLASFDSDL